MPNLTINGKRLYLYIYKYNNRLRSLKLAKVAGGGSSSSSMTMPVALSEDPTKPKPTDFGNAFNRKLQTSSTHLADVINQCENSVICRRRLDSVQAQNHATLAILEHRYRVEKSSFKDYARLMIELQDMLHTRLDRSESSIRQEREIQRQTRISMQVYLFIYIYI